MHPDLNNYPGEHRVITSDRNNGGKTAKIGLNLSQTEMILLYFIFPWSLAHAIYTYTHMANDSLHQWLHGLMGLHHFLICLRAGLCNVLGLLKYSTVTHFAAQNVNKHIISKRLRKELFDFLPTIHYIFGSCHLLFTPSFFPPKASLCGSISLAFSQQWPPQLRPWLHVTSSPPRPRRLYGPGLSSSCSAHVPELRPLPRWLSEVCPGSLATTTSALR